MTLWQRLLAWIHTQVFYQDNPPPMPSTQPQDITHTDIPYPDWSTPHHCYHNVRVLCDLAGLALEEKNLLCACVYQESQFYNYEPNGVPVQFHNKSKDGTVWSTDWGLCQINDYFHIGVGKDFESVDYVLQNPDKVFQWMMHMYRGGELRQWSSFSSGAYKKWLLPNSPMWQLSTTPQ